jgi:hypothetical protein
MSLLRKSDFCRFEGQHNKVICNTGIEAAARSVAVQSDGKILVVGYSQFEGNYKFAVVRYLP